MKHCQDCQWWSPNKPKFKEGDESFCTNLKIWIHTVAELGCDNHLAETDVEVNVPQHTRNGIDMPENTTPVDGPVEILIVTHEKDMPWLEYCLAAISKYCTGFFGVTIAHPQHQEKAFYHLHQFQRLQLHLQPYEEVVGKGMLQHMVKMAEADRIVPDRTKYVMHLDADCIYHTPTRPEDYFRDGLPVWLVRSWESLITEDPNNPGSKVISDCHQWRKPTDAQLGFNSWVYAMCRHPSVIPVEFYQNYRRHIAHVQSRDFADYMLSGRNSFPQDRMDFTAMGAFANRTMFSKFYWHNLEKEPPPKDRQKTYWSHGGITPEIRAEMEGFLK